MVSETILRNILAEGLRRQAECEKLLPLLQGDDYTTVKERLDQVIEVVRLAEITLGNRQVSNTLA